MSALSKRILLVYVFLLVVCPVSVADISHYPIVPAVIEVLKLSPKNRPTVSKQNAAETNFKTNKATFDDARISNHAEAIKLARKLSSSVRRMKCVSKRVEKNLSPKYEESSFFSFVWLFRENEKAGKVYFTLLNDRLSQSQPEIEESHRSINEGLFRRPGFADEAGFLLRLDTSSQQWFEDGSLVFVNPLGGESPNYAFRFTGEGKIVVRGRFYSGVQEIYCIEAPLPMTP